MGRKRSHRTASGEEGGTPGNSTTKHTSGDVSQRKSKRRRRTEGKDAGQVTGEGTRANGAEEPVTKATVAPAAASVKVKRPHTATTRGRGSGSKLQAAFRKKLAGGQFRWLNQELYTTTGKEAFATFQADKTLFDAYHSGYREQVAKWPINPLDVIIRTLSKLPPGTRIADFGCGEAKLARKLCGRHTVHSFDLVAANKFITACDIAHVPLADATVDVAVFCLSLMGTGYADYLREAHRVLANGGRLVIAEVRSRFESVAVGPRAPSGAGAGAGAGAGGGAPTAADRGRVMQKFVKLLGSIGFSVKHESKKNKMFLMLQCKKVKPKGTRAKAVALKACQYKRR